MNTPSKHGSGKAWPHGPPARSACAVSSAISSTASSPSVSTAVAAMRARPGSARPPHRTLARSARVARARSVRPAAMAWPPNLRSGRARAPRWHRARRGCGCRRSSAPSRAGVASPASAKAITGRRTRSFTRLATRPTTPWCQLSSYRHTPLRCSGRGPGRLQRAAPRRAPRPACGLRSRGARC